MEGELERDHEAGVHSGLWSGFQRATQVAVKFVMLMKVTGRDMESRKIGV
jgi:hypothetical protein